MSSIKMNTIGQIIQCFFTITALLVTPYIVDADTNSNRRTFIGVMAPLYVHEYEWGTFEKLLIEAKDIGVEAVSVDVWWGLVYQTRDMPTWEYYDRIFEIITKHDLKIVPIMATHKCGGGPGDNCLCETPPQPGQEEGCAIPLPRWLYTEVSVEAEYNVEDMMFKSETGRLQDDALAPWTTEAPKTIFLNEFKEFYEAFRDRYLDYAQRGDFAEINISTGPTGELRYPSYNMADGWQFPDAGYFQASSNIAAASFSVWLDKKYQSADETEKTLVLEDIEAVDKRTPIITPLKVVEPNLSLSQKRKRFLESQYGQDVIKWYSDSLIKHGQRLLILADQVFNDDYDSIPLGLKIPGIHWQLQCTDTFRYAEITAGLITADYDHNSESAARRNDHGYVHIFKMISETKKQIRKKHPSRDIILHFTALEMDNDPGCNMNSTIHGTSLAESLVYWISDGAEKWRITIRGENALPWIGGKDDPWWEDRNWDLIGNALEQGSYSGFTFLRLWNKKAWTYDKEYFEKFIERVK